MKFKLSLFTLVFAMAVLPAAAACTGNNTSDPDDDTKIETPDDEIPSDETPTDDQPADGDPDEEPQPVYEVKFETTDLLLATLDGYNTATVSASVYCDGELLEDASPTYTVTDGSVATLDGEMLTAIRAGETGITASYTVNEDTVSASTPIVVLAEASAVDVNAFEEEVVNLFGRTYISAKRLTFDNVCTGIEVSFAGTSLSANLYVSAMSKVRVYVDDDMEGAALVLTNTKAQETVLCEDLEDGIHTVRILKAASPMYGRVYLPDTGAFKTDGTFLAAREKSEFKIEFIGDSITAGCGANGTSLESDQTVENSDATLAYAYLTAQALDADFSMMALEGICVKDSNVKAYDTYTQYSPNYSGAYDPAKFEADVVVLALGENDMWHATSDLFPNYNVTLLEQDYADMLRLIRTSHPTAKIVCVYGMMPASSTKQTTQVIKAAIEATGDENITTLFMTSNERGANYHPNAAAHQKNAAALIKHINGLFE